MGWPHLLYVEGMTLSTKTFNIEREVYDFFGVCGDVGGVMTVFITIASFLVTHWNECHFQLTVIKKLFKIKKQQKLEEPGLWQRIRLVLNFYPDKDNKRLLEKGVPLLEKALDIIDVGD